MKRIPYKLSILFLICPLVVMSQNPVTSTQPQQPPKEKVFSSHTAANVKDKEHTNFKLSVSRMDPNYYEYNQDAVLRLGSGFNPLSTGVTLQSPFVYTIDTIENVSSLSTQLDYILITSYNQLKEELKQDVKFSASYGMFGNVDASVSFYRDLNFQSSSVYLLVKGETEYGRIELKPKHIKPEVIEMLFGSKARKEYIKSGYTLLPQKQPDASSVAQFRKVYGSKIPMIKRHGAKVYILIEISNMSKEEIKSISASVSASAKIGLFSASMKANFNEKISKKMESGEVRMKLLTKGGDGFKHLGRLLSYISSRPQSVFNGNPLGTLGNLTGEYLQKFNFANSAPLGFFCPSYQELGFTDITYTDKLEVYNELMEINNRYLLLTSWVARIDNILNPHSPISIHVEPEVRKKLESARPECYAYILQLRETFKKIIDANEVQDLPEFSSSVGFTENDLNISQITFDKNTESSVSQQVFMSGVKEDVKNKKSYYEINGKNLREVILSWESENPNCPSQATGPARLVAASVLLENFYKGQPATQPVNANQGVTVEMDKGLFSIKIEHDFLQKAEYAYNKMMKFQDPKCGIEATHSMLVYVEVVDLFGNARKYELGKAFPWCADAGCANYALLFFPYKAPLDITDYAKN